MIFNTSALEAPLLRVNCILTGCRGCEQSVCIYCTPALRTKRFASGFFKADRLRKPLVEYTV
jgi:hypothetical protein